MRVWIFRASYFLFLLSGEIVFRFFVVVRPFQELLQLLLWQIIQKRTPLPSAFLPLLHLFLHYNTSRSRITGQKWLFSASMNNATIILVSVVDGRRPYLHNFVSCQFIYSGVTILFVVTILSVVVPVYNSSTYIRIQKSSSLHCLLQLIVIKYRTG